MGIPSGGYPHTLNWFDYWRTLPMRRAEAGTADVPDEEGERMANQWLKRCCVGAMIAVVTASSLPMQAFAEAGGVSMVLSTMAAFVFQHSPSGRRAPLVR